MTLYADDDDYYCYYLAIYVCSTYTIFGGSLEYGEIVTYVTLNVIITELSIRAYCKID